MARLRDVGADAHRYDIGPHRPYSCTRLYIYMYMYASRLVRRPSSNQFEIFLIQTLSAQTTASCRIRTRVKRDLAKMMMPSMVLLLEP